MKDPILTMKLLARTEMALGRIHARRATIRVILSIIALVFVLLGLSMLNFSGYQAFAARFSPALASLFVALINIIIAIAIFSLAGKAGADSNEEKMAREIRDLAYSGLNADVDALKSEFSKVSDDVRRIRTGLSSITDTASSIVPLLGLVTKAVRKGK